MKLTISYFVSLLAVAHCAVIPVPAETRAELPPAVVKRATCNAPGRQSLLTLSSCSLERVAVAAKAAFIPVSNDLATEIARTFVQQLSENSADLSSIKVPFAGNMDLMVGIKVTFPGFIFPLLLQNVGSDDLMQAVSTSITDMRNIGTEGNVMKIVASGIELALVFVSYQQR